MKTGLFNKRPLVKAFGFDATLTGVTRKPTTTITRRPHSHFVERTHKYTAALAHMCTHATALIPCHEEQTYVVVLTTYFNKERGKFGNVPSKYLLGLLAAAAVCVCVYKQWDVYTHICRKALTNT